MDDSRRKGKRDFRSIGKMILANRDRLINFANYESLSVWGYLNGYTEEEVCRPRSGADTA